MRFSQFFKKCIASKSSESLSLFFGIIQRPHILRADILTNFFLNMAEVQYPELFERLKDAETSYIFCNKPQIQISNFFISKDLSKLIPKLSFSIRLADSDVFKKLEAYKSSNDFYEQKEIESYEILGSEDSSHFYPMSENDKEFYIPCSLPPELSINLIALPRTCFYSGSGRFIQNNNIPMFQILKPLDIENLKKFLEVSTTSNFHWGQTLISYGAVNVTKEMIPLIEGHNFGLSPNQFPDISSDLDTFDRMSDFYFRFLTPTYLASDVAISQTVISNRAFKQVMGYSNSDYDAPELPVCNLSWLEAVEFCNKISILAGLEPIYEIDQKSSEIKWYRDRIGFRLPTSFEHQCASRENSPNLWSGTPNIREASLYVVSSQYAQAQRKSLSKPISCNPSYKDHIRPNNWGFYHMSGNVEEWLHDSDKSHSRFLGFESTYSFDAKRRGGDILFCIDYKKDTNDRSFICFRSQDVAFSSELVDSEWNPKLSTDRLVKAGSFISKLPDCIIGKRMHYPAMDPGKGDLGFRVALQKGPSYTKNLFLHKPKLEYKPNIPSYFFSHD